MSIYGEAFMEEVSEKPGRYHPRFLFFLPDPRASNILQLVGRMIVSMLVLLWTGIRFILNKILW